VALIFVVRERQRAPGQKVEDFSVLIFIYRLSFICAYLLN
jgi:hypothetical protein